MNDNKQYLFEVVELSHGKRERYTYLGTQKEMSTFLKNKRQSYGYIPGCGGDRTFEVMALILKEI